MTEKKSVLNQKRKKLKEAKEAAIKECNKSDKRETKGTILVEIGRQNELFHDEIGEGYVTIQRDGYRETWLIKSETFAGYLMDEFFRLTNQGVSRSLVSDATDTLKAAARVDGKQLRVYRRTAFTGGKLYIDLCDQSWRAVEVSTDGWKVISNHDIKFLRNTNSVALPVPVSCGKLDELWNFLNVKPEDRPLIAGFLVRALHPEGPFFCLAVNGEQGTGKSTASKIIRSLVDPSTAMLRPPPKDERDFLAGAVNNWCITYDNLSGIKPWLSDALCRILTGGSFASRTLYSTTDETAIPLARPVIINGIDDLMSRPDLADRTISIMLQPIAESERLDERDMWKKFAEAKGKIFGVLLDGLCTALRDIDTVNLPHKPRMIDAAKWATAAEKGLGLPRESFIRAYQRKQQDMVTLSLESSPFMAAIMDLLADKKNWQGSPAQLLALLPKYARDDEAVKSKAWPKTAAWVSRMLRRHAPSLRKIGICVEFSRNSTERTISLSMPVDRMPIEQQNVTPHGQFKNIDRTDGFPQNFRENAGNIVIPSQNKLQNDSINSNDGKIPKVSGSHRIVEVEI